MKNYRSTKKDSEIKNIVSQSQKSKKNIVWQTNGEFRQVFEVLEIIKDIQLNLLIIKLDLNFGQIDTTKDIYVKFAYENSVYKTRCLRFQDDKITIISPSELHTTEKRHAPRKRFRSYQDANVDLAMSVYEDFSKPHNLRLRLLDISFEGFAINVSKTNLDFIRSCLQFNLLEINGRKLASPKAVKLRYVTAVVKNSGGKQNIINRVGFSFVDSFTKEQLKMYF